MVGNPEDPRTQKLLRTVYDLFVPNKVVALLDPAWPDAATITQRVPLLAGKQIMDDQPTAYVCRHYACQQPTGDPEALRQQLSAVPPA